MNKYAEGNDEGRLEKGSGDYKASLSLSLIVIESSGGKTWKPHAKTPVEKEENPEKQKDMRKPKL